jgi:hypothetical protein
MGPDPVDFGLVASLSANITGVTFYTAWLAIRRGWGQKRLELLLMSAEVECASDQDWARGTSAQRSAGGCGRSRRLERRGWPKIYDK